MLEYKIKHDNYIADMLWALGNGMKFKEYQRWHEVISPPDKKQEQEQPQVTKEMMKEHVASLRTKTS